METKHKTFKPFDKVLVKDLTDGRWTPDLYSYYDDSRNLHWSIGCGWVPDENILFYEGNENFAGRVEEPDEEVRLEEGEYIIYNIIGNINSSLVNEYALGVFLGIDKTSSKGYASIKTYYGIRQAHAFIKFSDFDPSNMEETKKHILCMKDGKIVRYKNNN